MEWCKNGNPDIEEIVSVHSAKTHLSQLSIVLGGKRSAKSDIGQIAILLLS
jgi:hypothetical protein